MSRASRGGGCSMRRFVLSLLFGLIPVTAVADESPVGISQVDAPGVNLYYYDSLGYLVPHAVRTFTNSLAWHRRMFGWEPSEATIVLLQDLADYGNATTFAYPHSLVNFDVSPLSFAFEIYPASDRLYTLMNHELFHVMTNDISSAEEQKWRRFFLGKVAVQRQNPETLLYSYLTVPRFTAPRWWS